MELQKVSPHMVIVEDGDGRVFRLEDTQHNKIRITVPDDRIMYKTEEGANNADFVELVK